METGTGFALPTAKLGAIPAFEPAEGLFPPLRSARRVLGRNGGSRLPKK